MNLSRKLVFIIAASFFCIGLSVTSTYAQRDRNWRHDNGRDGGWNRQDRGRHLGWYKHNRDRRWSTMSYGYPRRYNGYGVTQRYYYPQTYGYPRRGIYRSGRIHQRRSGLAASLRTLIRSGRRY
jgi:hypothetical protein